MSRTLLASAADARYGWWLLNLIGSVQANTRRLFDAFVVYDLGLTPLQRRLVAAARGVELRDVPDFAPHWRQGRTWKPWIWTQLEADRVVWLDAAVTVLAPLDEPLAQIERQGYWLVSQDHPVEEIVPSDYYGLYSLDQSIRGRIVVASGVVGFARPGDFFDRVVVPTFEDALAGRALGVSAGRRISTATAWSRRRERW